MAASPKARMPMISLRRMFDSARTDRFTTGWTTSPTAAHEIINRNQVKLVARSRELAANNDHAKKFIGLCVTNIIGNKGIVMQAQAKAQDGKLDKAANEAIEATWRTWCRGEHCDIKGRRNLKAMMQSLIRTAAKDGEIFIHIVENDTFTDFGIALQTIDPQRCPVDLNEELSGGRYIQHGIEFDKNGRRVAYYFQTKRAQFIETASNISAWMPRISFTNL